MTGELAPRRMTLRQLLAYTEKCARELQDLIRASLLDELSDFRDLSRPVRRKSHYPKLLAVQNASRNLVETNEKVVAKFKLLEECLLIIREHAKREIVNRL